MESVPIVIDQVSSRQDPGISSYTHSEFLRDTHRQLSRCAGSRSEIAATQILTHGTPAEIEQAAGCLDNRLLELKGALADQNTRDVTQDVVKAALREFSPVWDHLSITERVRTLNLVLRQVTYRSETITVEFS